MEEKTLIVATGNAHKMEEIRQILSGSDLHVISMKEAGLHLNIVEDGKTFTENARIKARAVTEATGHMAMADDSGLVIDALNGEPGIYSARYMGEDTSYDIKNQNLIDRLQGLEGSERAARFVCAMVCTFPDGSELVCEETMEGEIAKSIAGENGFGYDPILFLPDKGVTSAQLSAEEKNAISHRGKALRRISEMLKAGEAMGI